MAGARTSCTVHPVLILHTSPRRYVSFHRALNLRRPHELTGDWHALAAWFHADDAPRTAALAGEGQRVDTTPALGARGVPADGPVWVATHPRAIADLVALDLLEGRAPRIACVRQINAWLDTEAQLDDLRTRYLVPLRVQLHGRARAILDAWLPTVRFED